MTDTDDRALDIDIAQLLGWRWEGDEGGVQYLRHPNVPGFLAMRAGDDVYPMSALLPYSSDIGAAWVVWRKVGELPPYKLAVFWSALRSLVQLRLGLARLIGDAQAALQMSPADICKAMLEAHGKRMLPDWYYEEPE